MQPDSILLRMQAASCCGLVLCLCLCVAWVPLALSPHDSYEAVTGANTSPSVLPAAAAAFDFPQHVW